MRSKQVSAIVYGEPTCGKHTLVSHLSGEKNGTLKIEDKSVKATYNLSFSISQEKELIPDDGTLCLIFVLDITKKDALQRLNQLFIQKIDKSHMPLRNIQVLVATHLDQSNSRKVTTKEMKGFAIEHGMLFQEVSLIEPTVNIDGLVLQISNKTRIILKNTKWDNQQEQQQSSQRLQSTIQMSDRIKINQMAINIATTTAASASSNNQQNSNRNISSQKYQSSSRYLTGQEEEEEEEAKSQGNKSIRSSNTKHKEQQQQQQYSQSGQIDSIEQKISLKIANSSNIQQKQAYATIQKRDSTIMNQPLQQQIRNDSKANVKDNEGISSSVVSSNSHTSNQAEKKETQENLLQSMFRQKITQSKNQTNKNKDSGKLNNTVSNSNNMPSSGSLIKEGRQSTPLDVLKSQKSTCQEQQQQSKPDSNFNNQKNINDHPSKLKAGTTSKKTISNAQMETEQQKLIKLTSSVKLIESDSLDENENEGRTLPPEPQKTYHQNDNQPTTRSMEEYLATENLILLLQQDHRLDLETKKQLDRSTGEIQNQQNEGNQGSQEKEKKLTKISFALENQEKNLSRQGSPSKSKGNYPNQINYQDILKQLEEDQRNRNSSNSPQYKQNGQIQQDHIEPSRQDEAIQDPQEIMSSEGNEVINSHDISGEEDNLNKQDLNGKYSDGKYDSNSERQAINPSFDKPQLSNQVDFLASEYVKGLFGFSPEEQQQQQDSILDSEDQSENNNKSDFKLSQYKGYSIGNMKQSGFQEKEEKNGKQLLDMSGQQQFFVDSFDIQNPLISSPSLTRTRIQSQLSQQAQVKGNSQENDDDNIKNNSKIRNNSSKNTRNIDYQVTNSDEDPVTDSEHDNNNYNDDEHKWDQGSDNPNHSKDHYRNNSRLSNNENNHLRSTDLKNNEKYQYQDIQSHQHEGDETQYNKIYVPNKTTVKYSSSQSGQLSQDKNSQHQSQPYHQTHNSVGQSSYNSNKSSSSIDLKNQKSHQQSSNNSSDSPPNIPQIQTNGSNLLNQHHNPAYEQNNQFENYSSFNEITNKIPQQNRQSPLKNNNSNLESHLQLPYLRSNSDDQQQNLLRFSFSSNQFEDSLETNQPSTIYHHPMAHTNRCLSQDERSMFSQDTKYQKIRSLSCINPKRSLDDKQFGKNTTLQTILHEINSKKQAQMLQGSSSIYSTTWSKAGSNYQKDFELEPPEIIETELEFDMDESATEETNYVNLNRHSSSNNRNNQPTYQQYFNLNTAFDSNRNQLQRSAFFSKSQKPLLSLAIHLQGQQSISVDVYSDDNSFCVAERYFAMQQKAASRESIRKLALIVQQRINEYTAELGGLVERLEKLKVQSDYQPQLSSHVLNNNNIDSAHRLNKGLYVLSPLLSPSEQSQTSSQAQSQANKFFNASSKDCNGQTKSYQKQQQQSQQQQQQQQRQPLGMIRLSQNQMDKSAQQQHYYIYVNQRQLQILVDSNEDVYEQAFRVIEQYCLPKSCVHQLVRDITEIQQEMQLWNIDNNQKMPLYSKLRNNNNSNNNSSSNNTYYNNTPAINNRENILSNRSNNKIKIDNTSNNNNNNFCTINLASRNINKTNNKTSCVIFSPSAKGVHRYIGAMTANAYRNTSHTPPKEQIYQQIVDLTGNQGNYINNNNNNMKGSYSFANNRPTKHI